jgi:CRP/FNR family transcriptional regulator, cyclic AMP receptor protein
MNNMSLFENKAISKERLRPLLSNEFEQLSSPTTRKASLLSSVPDEALTALMEKAKIVKYPKQAVVISQGSVANALFIILSGKVRVFTSDDNKNKDVTLTVQESGSYFGEIALLTNEPRSASVVTLEKTVCAVISKNDFNSWLRTYPDMAMNLLSALSEEVRHLTEKVRQMALSNVYERTAKALQELAVVEGDGNLGVIQNKPTQQDLASMVGASREMVGKIMHDLIKGGYVVIEDKKLTINKKLPSSW